MTDYLQNIPHSDLVSDIRVTNVTNGVMRFATAPLLLMPYEPQELVGEVRFRLRIHLERLETAGQIEVEPIVAEPSSEDPQPPKGKKPKAKKAKPSVPPPASSEPNQLEMDELLKDLENPETAEEDASQSATIPAPGSDETSPEPETSDEDSPEDEPEVPPPEGGADDLDELLNDL